MEMRQVCLIKDVVVCTNCAMWAKIGSFEWQESNGHAATVCIIAPEEVSPRNLPV